MTGVADMIPIPRALPPEWQPGAASSSVEALHTIRETFLRAVAAHPEMYHESIHLICGQPVRLRCMGHKLADSVVPAFQHLREEPGGQAPRLTIELWDEDETGVVHPDLPDLDDARVWEIADSTYWHSVDERVIGYRDFPWVTLLDRHRPTIVGWTSSAAQILTIQRAKPLRLMMSLWQHQCGIHTVHAAFVAHRQRGLLFAGNSGAGKSTCALACLSGGLDFLSDDIIALEEDAAGRFTGHGVYSTASLWPSHARRFPELVPLEIEESLRTGQKSVLLLSRTLPERMARSAPVNVVVLPRVIGSGDTRLRPASKAEALLSLAPSSIFINYPLCGSGGMQALARLVEQVPCYWLDLGGDLRQIPHCVRDLLEQATQS